MTADRISDARVDRIGRGIGDVGREEQARAGRPDQLARQRRHERRRVTVPAHRRRCVHRARRARRPRPRPTSRQTRRDRRRPRSGSAAARAPAARCAAPAPASPAFPLRRRTPAMHVEQPVEVGVGRDAHPARRRRHRRDLGEDVMTQVHAHDVARAVRSRQRRANASHAASAPTTPCSAGCSRARSSAKYAATPRFRLPTIRPCRRAARRAARRRRCSVAR